LSDEAERFFISVASGFLLDLSHQQNPSTAVASPDSLAVTTGTFMDVPGLVSLEPPNGEQEMPLLMSPGSSQLGPGHASSTGCPCVGSTHLTLTFDKNVQAGSGNFVLKLSALPGAEGGDVVVETVDVEDASKVLFTHLHPDHNANTAANPAYALDGSYLSDSSGMSNAQRGSSVTITLSNSTLSQEGRTYYCVFASGVVVDQQVNPNPFPGFADNSSWSFRVSPDRLPPAVVATLPVAGATGLPFDVANPTIVFLFSEAVVANTAPGFESAVQVWSTTTSGAGLSVATNKEPAHTLLESMALYEDPVGEGSVRLAGADPWSGRLEVLHNDEWGESR
jgi:hypothetical protein